jgi:hypothetical protein
MSDEFVDTTRSPSPTGGQADCDACRNGVHADCAGARCGCFQRTCERAVGNPGAFITIDDVADAAAEAFGRDPARPKPRLTAQWAAVPGDIGDQTNHSYEGVLMETADKAVDLLQRVAAQEGKKLKRPIMCRVVVEAWVEDQ